MAAAGYAVTETVHHDLGGRTVAEAVAEFLQQARVRVAAQGDNLLGQAPSPENRGSMTLCESASSD